MSDNSECYFGRLVFSPKHSGQRSGTRGCSLEIESLAYAHRVERKISGDNAWLGTSVSCTE